MKKVLFALLLSLILIPLPLFAVDTVSIHPMGPTSIDPITLHIPITACTTEEFTVNRVGDVIKVELDLAHVCDPPVTVAQEVKLEPLPPGSYKVEVFEKGRDGVLALGLFVVRNGGPRLVEAHPFAIRTNILDRPRVRLTRTDGEPVCQLTDCSDIILRVGGAVPNDVESAGDGAAWFTAPPLSRGLVDIDIVRNDTIQKTVGALYYFDEPDPSIFERILFPVLDDTAGAGGSHWISEAVLANPNRWWVENYNSILPIVCITYPCGERLGPQSYARFLGDGYPHGVILHAPRNESDALSFSLRARDTSRASQGFGTGIPVVRERDMARDHALALLDVPRDPRYRVKIRMYAIEPFFLPQSPTGQLTIIDPATGARTEQTIAYSPATAVLPAFAELDLPAGAENQRSAIYLEPPAESFGWAFASVTNNETQEVTIITPSGAGEVPCATCREP